jgi:thiamine-monophosphate kinase
LAVREFAFIERLAAGLQAKRADTRLAIGDDAALIAPAAGVELAVTTDTLIAGRHFPKDTEAYDIGYKALAVNLSDLAAMAAEPAWATLALAAPELDGPWCDAFLDGAKAAIGNADVDIVGGDTTRGPLTITVTAIGTLPTGSAIRRAGAKPGDVIAVTGTLGDAALGLKLWPQRQALAGDAHARFLLSRLARPAWRNGAAMRGLASAAIDISDGLRADLGHVLTASGVGARIDVDALPASAAFRARVDTPSQRRELQLGGGDDYELCLTVAPADLPALATRLDCSLTPIGAIEADPGPRLVDSAGEPIDPTGLEQLGWDHFR